MKKYFIGLCLVLLSVISQAMEPEIPLDSLEALRKIVVEGMPLPVYEPEKDKHKRDEKRRSEAEKFIQEGCFLFSVPLEIWTHHIFPYLDSKTLLLGISQTCHTFSELSKLSFFYLNEYCLMEEMPHNLPVPLLQFKTFNTKDGIFKLAALMSVSAGHLKQWFEPEFLKAVFESYQNQLPAQLKEQSGEVLETLYPRLKVALASGVVDMNNSEDPVAKLLCENSNPNFLFCPKKLGILSLNPTRPGVYYQTLGEMLRIWKKFYPHLPNGVYPIAANNVIARELLMAGKEVERANYECFVRNPSTKELAINILKWCCHNPEILQNFHGADLLLLSAHALDQPDLELMIMKMIVDLPNDQVNLFRKISAISEWDKNCLKNGDLQEPIQKFFQDLFSNWNQVPGGLEVQALSLFAQAEKREEFQKAMEDVLENHPEEIWNYDLSCLVKAMSKAHYSEELEKLVRYLLEAETGEKIQTLLSGPFPDKNIILTHALKIDRERTLGLLKSIAESEQAHVIRRFDALVFLAQHAPEEREYILSKADVSNYPEEDLENVKRELGELYYHLNESELCNFYYQKGLESFLKLDFLEIREHKARLLSKLQEGGLQIKALEELQNMDPFEVYPVIISLED